jgi:dipeptidase
MEVMMGGDKFENIHNATIVNRSLVEKSFNKVKSDFDEETAEALKKVADEIERSHNKEAAETFDSFNEELQKPEPKRAVLRALWSGITTVLPTIVQMTDVTTKIAKLLGS